MLYRRGRKKIWYYQCKVKGKICKRSTGETEKRRALLKVPALETQARSLRECSDERPSHFMAAMANEITRVELDVSPPQAERVGNALSRFAQWVGRDIPLAQVTTEMLHDYERHRIHHDHVAYATKLAEAVGQNAWAVKTALGHKHISTTQGYVQVEAEIVPIEATRYHPAGFVVPRGPKAGSQPAETGLALDA